MKSETVALGPWKIGSELLKRQTDWRYGSPPDTTKPPERYVVVGFSPRRMFVHCGDSKWFDLERECVRFKTTTPHQQHRYYFTLPLDFVEGTSGFYTTMDAMLLGEAQWEWFKAAQKKFMDWSVAETPEEFREKLLATAAEFPTKLKGGK